jgi:hypothetical protein
VYVVFIPTNINNTSAGFTVPSDAYQQSLLSNLHGGQYTTYSLLALRQVGDQPGRPTARYLTAWRTLPTGVFIATNKFSTVAPAKPAIQPFHLDIKFPFPIVSTNTITPDSPNYLPYIAFDYLGRLVVGNPGVVATEDEYIPLARGSVLYPRTAGGTIDTTMSPDVKENPINNSVTISNVVHIDALTGRARIEKQELQ